MLHWPVARAIIEVKAGAFTYTSPMLDTTAYLESIASLALKPIEQGRRFLSYLESMSQVDLFDKDHNKVFSLRDSTFKQKVIMAVTLDGFTQISASLQHLAEIGMKFGQEPIWSISVDDLMVYSECFDNPLIFLHFVKQRMEAAKRKDMHAFDELDHLGLYQKLNLYTLVLDDVTPEMTVHWNGYTDEIDQLFDKKLQDPSASTIVRQNMPLRFAEIVGCFAEMNESNRNEMCSLLLNTDAKTREFIADKIDGWLKGVLSGVIRQGIYYSSGGTAHFYFYCSHPLVKPVHQSQIEKRVKATIVQNDEPSRFLMLLDYDDDGILVKASGKNFSATDIDDIERVSLKEYVATMREERVARCLSGNVKIGRNDPCPCGSGLKYKKCCLHD